MSSRGAYAVLLFVGVLVAGCDCGQGQCRTTADCLAGQVCDYAHTCVGGGTGGSVGGGTGGSVGGGTGGSVGGGTGGSTGGGMGGSTGGGTGGGLGTGVACSTPSACASGFCVGGVCCGSVCADPCQTCSATPGTCTTRASGATPQSWCSGAVCSGTSTQCPLSCGSKSQCIEGYDCVSSCTPVPPVYDAASSTLGSGVTQLSWTHTVGVGSNRLLLVGVAMRQGTGIAGAVTSVSYGGLPLTKVQTLTGGGFALQLEVWSMINPAAGTGTVLVSFSKTTTSAVAGASSWRGVGRLVATQGTCGSFPVTVSNLTPADVLVDALAGSGITAASTVGTGQIELWNQVQSQASASANVRGASSRKAGTLGSSTLWWDTGGYLDSCLLVSTLRGP